MNASAFASLKKTFQNLSIIINNLEADNSALIDFDLSLEKTRILYEQLSELKLEKLSKKDSQIERKPDIVSTKKIEVELKKAVSEEYISDEIDTETERLLDEKESIEFVAEQESIETPA